MRVGRETAGPSTALRSGRDDNSIVGKWPRQRLDEWLSMVHLSSRGADLPVASQGTNYNGNESIGWPIQAVLWLEWATSPTGSFLKLPQDRHPACPGLPWERSASQIYRLTKGSWRAVEEPVPSIAEGTPRVLVSRRSSELSGHQNLKEIKKSQPPTGAKRSGGACGFFSYSHEDSWRRTYTWAKPPSTHSSMPVTKLLSSEARKTVAGLLPGATQKHLRRAIEIRPSRSDCFSA